MVGFVIGAPLEARGKEVIFDVQGHRGGRGEMIENTLPAFAWGLIDGVNTLEMDNGITKDGVDLMTSIPKLLGRGGVA